jgi:endonuclease/exonuclease/phosphatase family metal-dependent hydrolase
MTIETLNIWGGKLNEPLLEHIKRQSDTVDVFCFQEVYKIPEGEKPLFDDINPHIYLDIEKSLPDYQGYFSLAQDNSEGLALFVKKSIPVRNQGDVFVLRHKNAMVNDDATTLGIILQYMQIEYNGKPLTIANLHGLWTGGGKGDTPERLEQSQRIKEFLDTQEGSKILCGDFNPLLNTESINILEKDMLNLIKVHGVESTRSHYYTKPEKHADYILITPDISVVSFQVLPDPVSDHLSLVVEVN